MLKQAILGAAVAIFVTAERAAAGFDCNDPGWCLGVTDDGRVLLGNPFLGAGMNDTGKRAWQWKVTDRRKKERRVITVKCLPHATRPERAFICFGFDADGRYYSGDSREAGDSEFFRQRN